MEIITTKVTSLYTNCYLVVNGSEAFVIDPGADARIIFEKAEERNVKITAILLTHGHYDHVGGVQDLKELTGAKIYISESDFALSNSYKNLAFAFGQGCSLKKFDADVFVTDGTYEIAGLAVKVISTPGHTAGGVCYIVGTDLFSGDTLIELSYGRTDFPSGDFSALKQSIITKIFGLDGDFVVHTGHGESTTLNFERKNNPILYD